jgi:hypothetical protein
MSDIDDPPAEEDRKLVEFEKHEGVTVYVTDEGDFVWKLGEKRHERRAGSLRGARREITRQLRTEAVARREKPHAPCWAVVGQGSGMDDDPPSYVVLGGIFRGLSRADGTLLVEVEKKTFRDGKMLALFRPSDREAADKYASLLVAAWHAEHDARAFEKAKSVIAEDVNGRKYGVNGVRELLKQLDRADDSGAAVELVEDEVTARLFDKPSPMDALKDELRKALKKRKPAEGSGSSYYRERDSNAVKEALDAEP